MGKSDCASSTATITATSVTRILSIIFPHTSSLTGTFGLIKVLTTASVVNILFNCYVTKCEHISDVFRFCCCMYYHCVFLFCQERLSFNIVSRVKSVIKFQSHMTIMKILTVDPRGWYDSP